MALSDNIFPACFVKFPGSVRGRSAAFFLAAEEYVARELPGGNYVFFWQLNPTCVFGRNQVPHQELDVDFCLAHGIELVRRKSGGGAIFADQDNIMTSLVTGGGSVEPLFDAFARQVADGLRRLGAPTRVSGRNDIVLEDGRKICGNAFYHLPDRNIVHCTMLYDTNMELMTGALTPAPSKLQARGVESVRSRIGLLKEFFDFGVDELRERLRGILTDRVVELTPDDVHRIEEIEAPYHTPEYLFGQTASGVQTIGARIPGCGQIDFHVTLRGSLIDGIRLTGDFFETEGIPASEALTAALAGVPFTPAGVRRALEAARPERTVRGLTADHVIGLLFSTPGQGGDTSSH